MRVGAWMANDNVLGSDIRQVSRKKVFDKTDLFLFAFVVAVSYYVSFELYDLFVCECDRWTALSNDKSISCALFVCSVRACV